MRRPALIRPFAFGEQAAPELVTVGGCLIAVSGRGVLAYTVFSVPAMNLSLGPGRKASSTSSVRR
jgi:hypothetical protein